MRIALPKLTCARTSCGWDHVGAAVLAARAYLKTFSKSNSCSALLASATHTSASLRRTELIPDSRVLKGASFGAEFTHNAARRGDAGYSWRSSDAFAWQAGKSSTKK